MSSKRSIIAIILSTVFTVSFLLSAAQAAGYKTETFKKESGTYTVDIKYPEIIDKRLVAEARQKVNEEIKIFVHKLFDDDLKAFIEMEPEWGKEEFKEIPGKDTVYIDFKVILLDGDSVSIRFEKYFFGKGAAHGLTYIYGLNYDIGQMRHIAISDLFKPGTDYLKQISDYCIKDIKRQLDRHYADESWINEGASPKEENFREFALTKDSLIIFFQNYQVACYAAGNPQVKIPFRRLENYRNPG